MENYKTSSEKLLGEELSKEFPEQEEFSKYYFEKVGKYPSKDLLETRRIGLRNLSGKVFKIIPKHTKRANGTVLTPEMSVIVTTNQYTSDPFYNDAKEVKEAYLRIYDFDYQKACCSKMILRLVN